MTRSVLKTVFVWLCLLTHLVMSSSAAAGLVLCVEDDGHVAIETRLTQLRCCGDLMGEASGPQTAPKLSRDDGCVDVPLTFPASLRAPSSRDADGVGAHVSTFPALTAPLLVTAPSRTEFRRVARVLLPDRTRDAIATIVLLI